MNRNVDKLLTGLLLMGAILTAAPVSLADVTIVAQVETESIGKTQKMTMTQYFTADKLRWDYGTQGAMIIDLANERMITLMPATRTYMEQSFEDMKKMAALFEGVKAELDVEKTEETKEISGYKCRKVIFRGEMMGSQVEMEWWVTKEVKADSAEKAFEKGAYEGLKALPQLQRRLEAMKKISDEGLYPIKTVTRTKGPMGSMTITSTVTKIKKGDLDDSLFEIPEGYKKQTVGFFGGGSGSRN